MSSSSWSAWKQRTWYRMVATFEAALMVASCGGGHRDAEDSDDTTGETTSALGAPPTPPPTTAVAEGHGDFPTQVNNAGAFTYGIDLEVPSAIGKLAPSLRLNYSSQGDVGIAGVGWDLPLPVVTISQADGYRPTSLQADLARFPDNTAVERYTSHLGNIAVVRSGAVETYLFNPNNDLEVLPIADNSGLNERGEDLAAWQVRTKDGTAYRFGYAEQSSLWKDASTALKRKSAWYLDRVTDTSGNTMTYYWDHYPGAGDLYRQPVLSAIKYGQTDAHPNLPGYVVAFEYRDSPFARTSYRLGTLTEYQAVVSKMCIYAPALVASGNTVIQSWTVTSPNGEVPQQQYCYRFDYNFVNSTATTSGYTGRPLLIAVTKVGHDGATDSPWRFAYTHQNQTWEQTYRASATSPTQLTMPGANLYLTQSGHDATQLTADLDGDGLVDYVAGDPNGAMPVWKGTGASQGAITHETTTWPHPLAGASPITHSMTPIDAHQDSTRSNCWYDFKYQAGFLNLGTGLGYARDLTKAPPNFWDIYESSGASDEADALYVPLGGFQFLSSSFYGPFPAMGDEDFQDAADTIDELETFGSYKDTKDKEYAFDFRSADCQDAGDNVKRGYCWNLTGGQSTGVLGEELGCLDPQGSRWFTQDSKYASMSSRLWELRDLNGDGRMDWVFGANVIARTAGGEMRNMRDGANDWYVAFGNRNGWDPPVPWHMPSKDGDGAYGVDFVHATGLLSTSVSNNSAPMEARKFGASVCASAGGFSAPRPVVGSIPTSPMAAASVGMTSALGAHNTAQIMTGASNGSSMPSLLPSACMELTNQGVDVSLYLPLIGDLQQIEGSMSGSSSVTYQDQVDLNGDGRADYVSSRYDAGATLNSPATWLFYRNNGKGFEIPELFPFKEAPKQPYGRLIGSLQEDFNYRYSKTRWFTGDGDLFDSAYYGTTEQVAGLVDLNGDGLADLVTTAWNALRDFPVLPTHDFHWNVHFNQGDDFSEPVKWRFDGGWAATGCNSIAVQPKLHESVYFEDPSGGVHDAFVREAMGLHDVNRDGLLDFVYVRPYDREDGMTTDGICNYGPVDGLTSNSLETWTSFADPQHLQSPLMVRLNTGRSFDPPIQWVDANGFPMSGARNSIYPDGVGQRLTHSISRGVTGAGDFNGDGVVELAVLDGDPHATTPARFNLHKLAEGNPDRLSSMTLPGGGVYEVSYRHHLEPEADQGGGVGVTDRVIVRDLDATRTSSVTNVVSDRRMAYEHGVFDRETRRFLGFEKIYQYGSANGYTLTRYLPVRGFEGLPYCREVRRTASAASSLLPGVVSSHVGQWASGPPAGHAPAPAIGSAAKTATVPQPQAAAAETNAALAAHPAVETGGGATPDTAGWGGTASGPAADDPAQEATEGTVDAADQQRPYDGTISGTGLGEVWIPPVALANAPTDSVSTNGAPPADVPDVGPGVGITTKRSVLHSACSATPGLFGGVSFTCDATHALDGATCGAADDPGTLVSQEFHLWADRSSFTGLTTPREVETRHFLYDAGGANPRETKVTRTFDAVGNIVTEIDHGDVQVATDGQRTETVYAGWDPGYVVGLPCHETVKNAAGTVLAEQWYGYDGAGATSCAAPSKGLLTSRRVGIDATALATESFEYTAVGLVRRHVGMRNQISTLSYQATYPWMVSSVEDQVTDLVTPIPTYVVNLLVRSFTYHGADNATVSRFGLLATETDENQATTSTSWDSLRRITKIARPGDTLAAPTTSFAYETLSLPHSTTRLDRVDAANTRTTVQYLDGLGRFYKTETNAPPNARSATWVVSKEAMFDIDGRELKTYQPRFDLDPRGARGLTETTRDLLGRPTKLVGPNGASTTTTYDRERVTTTDPIGNVSYVELDGRGYPIVEADYSGGALYRSTSYVRRPDGKPTQITGPGGSLWSFVYDRRGLATELIDPDTGTSRTVFDANGNAVVWYDNRQVAGAGAERIAVAIEYDERNRPVRRTDYRNSTINGATVSGTLIGTTAWYWDTDAAVLAGATIATCGPGSSPEGRLARVDRSQLVNGTMVLASRKERCYDERGRVRKLTHWIDGQRYDYEYTHNGFDEVLQREYPDGDVVSSTYDKSGVLTAMQNAAGPLVSGALYNEAMNPTKRTIGAGGGARVQQWCFEKGHSANEVLGLAATGTAALGVNCATKTVNDHGVPTQLSHAATYVADAEGKPTQRTESYLDPLTSQKVTKTATYLHDAMDRLTRETYAGAQTTYASDVRDNLTTLGSVTECYGATVSCTAGAVASKPHQINSTSAGDRFLYDLAGNVKQWRRAAETYDYVYDADNRVTQVLRNNVVVANMLYDEDGTRVSKLIPSGPRTDYASDGYRANNAGGAPVVETVYPDVGIKVATAVGAQQYFTIADAVGSTSALINSAGANVQVQTYTPYGEVRLTRTSGAYASDRLFNGKERDDELGPTASDLYEFGPREYIADTGRWMAPDSTFSDGLNRYAFVRNSPIAQRDPTGREGVSALGIGPQIMLWVWYSSSSNVAAGYFDNATFGVTEYGRDRMDMNQGIDNRSWGYAAGERIADVMSGGLSTADVALELMLVSPDAYGAGRGPRGSGSSRSLGATILHILIKDTPKSIHWTINKVGTLPSGCEDWARAIQTKLGGGEIKRFAPRRGKIDEMANLDGTVAKVSNRSTDTGWAYHEVVVKDGRVYDAFTGPAGQLIDDYKARFAKHLNIDFGF